MRWNGQEERPFLDRLTVLLPEDHPQGQFDQSSAETDIAVPGNGQQAFDPFPARLLPPAFPLPVALTEQQAPSLGSDSLNLPLELFALTALDPLLFFGLNGHPHGC